MIEYTTNKCNLLLVAWEDPLSKESTLGSENKNESVQDQLGDIHKMLKIMMRRIGLNDDEFE